MFGLNAVGAGVSDADVRVALSSAPSILPAEPSLLVPEVECLRGYVRADYLGISEAGITVIEIKSDRDTLRRFEDQRRVYSAIADRVTLIVGWKHAARALRGAPAWWDVILVERENGGCLRFVPLRDGFHNPEIVPAARVAMLPVEDLRRIASKGGALVGSRLAALRERLATDLSREELGALLCEWLHRLASRRSCPLAN